MHFRRLDPIASVDLDRFPPSSNMAQGPIQAGSLAGLAYARSLVEVARQIKAYGMRTVYS